jgi:hypothetical protein
MMAKGKGGTALALIALIIGAGGAGFAFYSWYSQPEIPAQPQFWSNYNATEYYAPYSTYGNVIYVEFDLEMNYTLHLLYTGSTKILANPISFADMFFKFEVNGELLDNPFTRAGPYQGDSTYDYIPVTLQHVLVNVGPGYYNISVQSMTEEAGNLVRHNVLTVTAYPI